MVGGRWSVARRSVLWDCPGALGALAVSHGWAPGRAAVRPSGRAGVDEDAHDKGLLSPECL
jgi:hypothetical protein